MKTPALLSICLAFWALPGLSQDFDYSFSESYTVSTPAALAISTSDGDVDVMASDGNEMKVYFIARKMGRVLKINRAELEKEVILDIEHDRNGLRISVRHKEHDNFWNYEDQVDVGFRIYAPKETGCDIHTSDGDVSLTSLTSDQRCKTSDGDIRIESITGQVFGSTSDGDIHSREVRGNVDLRTSDGDIALNQISGDVQASTSDGDIRLSRVTGDVVAKTSDGGINFEDLSGSIEAITSDGNVYGNIVELRNPVTIKTSDGSIRVTMPDNLGLDLNIKGESIRVPLKNFSGRSDENTIQGKQNGGGVPVNLSSSDGDITVSYL